MNVARVAVRMDFFFGFHNLTFKLDNVIFFSFLKTSVTHITTKQKRLTNNITNNIIILLLFFLQILPKAILFLKYIFIHK